MLEVVVPLSIRMTSGGKLLQRVYKHGFLNLFLLFNFLLLEKDQRRRNQNEKLPENRSATGEGRKKGKDKKKTKNNPHTKPRNKWVTGERNPSLFRHPLLSSRQTFSPAVN